MSAKITHKEQREMNNQLLIDYIRANPNQNAKRIEAGLGWSQNKTLRYLHANSAKLLNGWTVK